MRYTASLRRCVLSRDDIQSVEIRNQISRFDDVVVKLSPGNTALLPIWFGSILRLLAMQGWSLQGGAGPRKGLSLIKEWFPSLQRRISQASVHVALCHAANFGAGWFKPHELEAVCTVSKQLVSGWKHCL